MTFLPEDVKEALELTYDDTSIYNDFYLNINYSPDEVLIDGRVNLDLLAKNLTIILNKKY